MGSIGILLILLCNQFLLGDRVQCTRSLSKGENHDMKIQLEISTNREINNIQILSEPINNNLTTQEYTHINSKIKKSRIGILPIGITGRKDLMEREHILDLEKMGIKNLQHTFLDVARTKVGAEKFTGGGGFMSIYNPKVVGQQFSATRIRLQAESIEVGWRVDPMLYGYSMTHTFVRTDAGQSHCFNTECPGYIHRDSVPIGAAFHNTSKPGKRLYSLPYYIIRDEHNGNWNLWNGKDPKDSKDSRVLRYWPSNIFQMGLVDHIEFGGAVYSPPGSPLPPMGSTNLPIGDYLFDGFICNIKVHNEKGEAIGTFDLELYTDNSKLYSVQDAGIQSEYLGRMILYGGPSHPSYV